MSTTTEETVCYRHPGRETAVACSNCGRYICTDCMTSTPVGMRCPECSKQRTKVHTVRSVQQAATWMTRAIIAVCVVVFLGEIATNGVNAALVIDGVPYVAKSAYGYGGVSAFTVDAGQYWRLLTAGFLHAEPPFGFLHLGFNMYLLFILGSMIEGGLGRVRFLLVFLVAVAGGSAISMLLQPDSFAVGASGGVFGLMAYALLADRGRGISPLQSQLGQLFFFNLVLTFVWPNVSVGGHVGGILLGAAAFFVVQELDRRRAPAPAGWAALGGLLAATLVAGVLVAGAVNPIG